MNNWKSGIVAWFDEVTGDGVVRADDGIRYYVHYSSIAAPIKDKQNSERRNLVKGEKVQFVTYLSNYIDQVGAVKAVKCQ